MSSFGHALCQGTRSYPFFEYGSSLKCYYFATSGLIIVRVCVIFDWKSPKQLSDLGERALYCVFDLHTLVTGASDDAVSCAVMLEVLHSLANQSTPLHHGVVFLFNGAEENVLQVSPPPKS